MPDINRNRDLGVGRQQPEYYPDRLSKELADLQNEGRMAGESFIETALKGMDHMLAPDIQREIAGKRAENVIHIDLSGAWVGDMRLRDWLNTQESPVPFTLENKQMRLRVSGRFVRDDLGWVFESDPGSLRLSIRF